MVSGGANLESMDMITNCERHPGSFEVHVKDASGNSFDTGFSNILIIDKGNTTDLSSPWKEYPPYHCWGERQETNNQTAMDKMISRWHDWKSLYLIKDNATQKQ